MNLSVSTRLPASAKRALLVVPWQGLPPESRATAIDEVSGGALSRAQARGDTPRQPGELLVLHELSGVPFERVMLVGAGESPAIPAGDYRRLAERLGRELAGFPVRQAWVTVAGDLEVEDRDVGWRHETLALALLDAGYRFTRHRGREAKRAAPGSGGPDRVTLLADADTARIARPAVRRAEAVATGMALARDLGNTAPNVCTPVFLADTAREMAGRHESLRVRVHDEKQIRRIGMGAFLSVSAGSRQPPRLIAMEYRGGAQDAPPVVFVGKGVTFDTGGISIKPSTTLDEMKFDMCGAACVFGVIEACCRLALPLNVVGVIAAAENMPDGNASRPGDVVESLSGQTIEILNTDAEGRMLLADCLTWIERYRPAVAIDVATLTGAAVIALGNVMTALFSNDEALVSALLTAGTRTGDRAWRLPMDREYQSQLDSPFADMANIGGRAAGAVTAACFLSRFVGEHPWAHLDIAGVASRSGKRKGATGRPVPMLMQFLFDRADATS